MAEFVDRIVEIFLAIGIFLTTSQAKNIAISLAITIGQAEDLTGTDF